MILGSRREICGKTNRRNKIVTKIKLSLLGKISTCIMIRKVKHILLEIIVESLGVKFRTISYLLECQLAYKLRGTSSFQLRDHSAEHRLFQRARLNSKSSFFGVENIVFSRVQSRSKQLNPFLGGISSIGLLGRKRFLLDKSSFWLI